MRKICILSVLVLAACGGDKDWKTYQCGAGKTASVVKARFVKDGAEVKINGGDKQALKQVKSADGAKYSAKGVEFWTKGANKAMLTVSKKRTDCVAK